jgi:hypothetical protein
MRILLGAEARRFRAPDLAQQVSQGEERFDRHDGLAGLAARACDRVHHPPRQRAHRFIRQLAQDMLLTAPSDAFSHDERDAVLWMPSIVDRERNREVGRMWRDRPEAVKPASST